MDALYRQYRGRGLDVRLVAFREPLDLVRRTVAERGYAAPVLFDESGDTTGRVWGVWGPPTVYLMDHRGRLLARAAGPVGWDSPAVRTLVESLLAEP